MVSIQEKVKIFENEFVLIFDDSIREFTKLCVLSAPDYFFEDCPASSTGKYHPISELGPDGTIIHTKKVSAVAYELCRGLECENHRDEIVAACIIHDLRKQGLEKCGWTKKNHPALGAQLVDEVYDATLMLSTESYGIIRCCVGYHYGPWSTDKWKKPLSSYAPEELCVYLSDYIASKRTIEVDYER